MHVNCRVGLAGNRGGDGGQLLLVDWVTPVSLSLVFGQNIYYSRSLSWRTEKSLSEVAWKSL